MRLLKIIPVLIAISSAVSCGTIFDEVSVSVIFPEHPAGFEIESWVLLLPDGVSGDGIPAYIKQTVSAAGGAEREIGQPFSVSTAIARGVNLPVLAYPVFAGGIRGGFPAGAFYPLDAGTEGLFGELALSWENGPACEIIRSCSLNSGVYRGFDVVRFRELLAAEAAEKAGGDLWSTDPGPVLCRLGYGLFREYAVKMKPAMNFSIPASGGVYRCDNPFMPNLEASAGILQVRAAENRKIMYFSAAGVENGETVSVYFDSRRWCWSVSPGGASESGRL
jgi:hypothetical protein